MFLEECYELIEAIEEGDTGKIVEELGDVFFHVMFQLKLGEDGGEFDREMCSGGWLTSWCGGIRMSLATSGRLARMRR